MMRKLIITTILTILCLKGMPQTKMSVDVTKPGTLTQLLSQEEKSNITDLVVSGKLNSSDICVLRQMAGAKEKDSIQQWTGQLARLDLSEVSFVNDKTPFYIKKVSQNFKFSVNVRYHIYTQNAKTGETRVTSRDEYMEERDFANNNGSLNRRLSYNDPNRKQSNIERKTDYRKEFVLKDMNERQWNDIVRRGWNERKDYYIKWEKGDTIHGVYNHTAKHCISSCMFLGCKKLEKVILPKNTQKIGNIAFDGCTSLIEVTIPKSVEHISENSFRKTPNLKKVIISKNSMFPPFQKKESDIANRFFKESAKDIEIIKGNNH